MSLQATLRARMSLRQTWRWATWVSLLRTCWWSLSYLTASSRSAFWVSPSIWMSCFSWTAPGNDLAWWCLRPSHFCPTWGSSPWANLPWVLPVGWPRLSSAASQSDAFLLILSPSPFPPTSVRPTCSLKALPAYSCPCPPLSFSGIAFNKCVHF